MTFPRRSAQAASSVALALALALLGGCAHRGDARSDGRDGPGANPPPGLERLPDAEPRVEPILPGGANKPYAVLGRSYVPRTDDAHLRETGTATWYGRKFHGQPTASGEPYDMYAMTAAHRSMPIPSYARVRNPANGREVLVRVNDRGPFQGEHVIDLSYAAALRLDLLRGAAPVEVERLTNEDIRSGAWRRGGAGATVAIAAPLSTAAPAMAPLPIPIAARPVEIADASAAADARSQVAPVWWLQLGSFRERDGAELLRQRAQQEADWLAPLGVFDAPVGYRVQAGPYASRAEALNAAERLQAALHLKPLIVQRR